MGKTLKLVGSYVDPHGLGLGIHWPCTMVDTTDTSKEYNYKGF